MAEKELVVAESRLSYEGLFSIDELHKVITDWLQQKQYDRLDKLHTQSIKPDGKYIDIELEPDKMVDDYTDLIIRIRIYASQLKDVIIEQDGRKKSMNDGKVTLVFDAWVKTDYAGRMDSKPVYTVMRTLFEKYIFKSQMARYPAQLKGDVAHLKETISNYLNLMKSR